MYVKVFSQILESSLSVDYEQRHIFMDLLVLADRTGVVDMTLEAISRRINVPVEMVTRNIKKLELPDSESRSDDQDGKRLVLLDEHRDWGWQIVNYEHYRDLVDLEALRVANRDRKRRQRERERQSRSVLNGHDTSRDVRDSHASSQKVTPSEADAEALSPNGDSPDGEKRTVLATANFWESLKNDPLFKGVDFEEERRKMAIWKKIPKNRKRQITEKFVLNWLAKADRNVELPNLNKSCL